MTDTQEVVAQAEKRAVDPKLSRGKVVRKHFLIQAIESLALILDLDCEDEDARDPGDEAGAQPGAQD